jgi:3-oxoadipate enol-lactonase/4-carboxymuconolactone decarboxylase
MPHLLRPDGARIAWETAGLATGPPILLCTMATAAMAVWRPVVDRLGGRWRLILHDRRGEGDSDAGPPESHALASFRDDALAVLDAAGVERAAVCGMAFGARVALRLALDAPNRVTRLALFDATGGPAAPAAEREAGRARAKALRLAGQLPEVPVDRAWFRRRDPAGAAVNARALAAEPAWVSGLERLRVPTLVACGEQDPNLSGARRLAREIPGARFVPLPMTGHGSILDRPDLVANHLSDFLRPRELPDHPKNPRLRG